MPGGGELEGELALTNAERQARYRVRHLAEHPPAIERQPRPPRQSRGKHRDNALAVMMTVQAGCAAWFEVLPERLRDSATAKALREIIDLDLEPIAAVRPPHSYGRGIGMPQRCRVPARGVAAVGKWPAGATVQSLAQAGRLSTAGPAVAVAIVDLRVRFEVRT